jgi:Protein of unknown function (DUF3052)
MQEVLKKLRFTDNATILNAPESWQPIITAHSFKTAFDKKTKATHTLAFINNQQELQDFLKNNITQVQHDSILWLAYPKGSSGIKTDINRDSLRNIAAEFGLATVTAISIDSTWSALRLRPAENVGH